MTTQELRDFVAAETAKAQVIRRARRLTLDCVNVGNAISRNEAARLGLNPERKWKACTKGHPPVCGCRDRKSSHCGPQCPDYEARTRKKPK